MRRMGGVPQHLQAVGTTVAGGGHGERSGDGAGTAVTPAVERLESARQAAERGLISHKEYEVRRAMQLPYPWAIALATRASRFVEQDRPGSACHAAAAAGRGGSDLISCCSPFNSTPARPSCLPWARALSRSALPSRHRCVQDSMRVALMVLSASYSSC